MQPLTLLHRSQQQQQHAYSRRAGLPRARRWHLLTVGAVLLTAAAALCWVELTANLGALPSISSRQQHTFAALDDEQADAALQTAGVVDDLLVHEVVRRCMQQQDTFISLQRRRSSVSVHVSSTAPQQQQGNCALFHIPLAASDRSIGLCTDAALYVQLLGGWIAPATPVGLSHAQRCGHRSAVLFLEPLYEPWLGWLEQQAHVVAAFAPNFEQLFGYDSAAHARMRLVLCKVRRCEQLMSKYLEDLGSPAQLMYTGHTSVDPQALLRHHQHLSDATYQASHLFSYGAAKRPSTATPPQDPSASQQQLAAVQQPLSVLHVRGKSGLKHTKQLLDCWLQHPEWPTLTVAGPMPNEQVSGAQARQVMAAANIRVPNPGKQQGPSWPEFEPLPAGELAALLLSHAVHVMPSEREGFGHSINEGRAAGAVLLVPDHPPMSELVREGSGILLAPAATFSHQDPPVPVLAKYGNISVSMSAEGICRGVSQVLAKTPAQRAEMGRQARRLFESDRAAFVDSMRDVLGELRSLLEVAEAAAGLEAQPRGGTQ